MVRKRKFTCLSSSRFNACYGSIINRGQAWFEIDSIKNLFELACEITSQAQISFFSSLIYWLNKLTNTLNNQVTRDQLEIGWIEARLSLLVSSMSKAQISIRQPTTRLNSLSVLNSYMSFIISVYQTYILLLFDLRAN